jgi:hypothetical protein
MKDVIGVQAEMMKTFAHPVRLQIIKSICKTEHSVNIFYSVANTKISKACMLMQEIALDNLKKKTKILKQKNR